MTQKENETYVSITSLNTTIRDKKEENRNSRGRERELFTQGKRRINTFLRALKHGKLMTIS